MLVDGEDMLVVTRSFNAACEVKYPFGSKLRGGVAMNEYNVKGYMSSYHKSSCIMFHRIPNFRDFVVDGMFVDS